MVTTHSSNDPPQGGLQTPTDADAAPEQPSDPGRPKALSERATAAIDLQRRTLQIADSMLGCLVIALEYSSWVPRRHRPDYSDAARGIRRILVTAIDELDSMNLERSIAAAEPRSP